VKSEVSVMLRVSGDLVSVREFQVNTEQLKGDVGIRKPEHALSGLPEAWWYTQVCLEDQESTSPAFDRFVETIGTGGEILKTAIAKNPLLVEIDCTIKGSEGVRIDIPSACISLAAYISASISFDLY
jgi:hypothetical protein